jgi:hypothetical protein
MDLYIAVFRPGKDIGWKGLNIKEKVKLDIMLNING